MRQRDCEFDHTVWCAECESGIGWRRGVVSGHEPDELIGHRVVGVVGKLSGTDAMHEAVHAGVVHSACLFPLPAGRAAHVHMNGRPAAPIDAAPSGLNRAVVVGTASERV